METIRIGVRDTSGKVIIPIVLIPQPKPKVRNRLTYNLKSTRSMPLADGQRREDETD